MREHGRLVVLAIVAACAASGFAAEPAEKERPKPAPIYKAAAPVTIDG